MKNPFNFETAISRSGKKINLKTNTKNNAELNLMSRISWGIVCISHSFTHPRCFQVYNEGNSCKHLFNIASRLYEEINPHKLTSVSDSAGPRLLSFTLSLSLSLSHQHISSSNELLHAVADPRLSLAFWDSWQNCHLLNRIIVASLQKCIICMS